MKTPFFNGEMIEEVYILPPLGVALKGKVWCLRKALYGLQQAARAGYEKWTKDMLTFGLKPTEADPRLLTSLFRLLYPNPSHLRQTLRKTLLNRKHFGL